MRNHRKQMSLSWKEHFHISLIVTIPEGFFGGIFIWHKLKWLPKKQKTKSQNVSRPRQLNAKKKF